jgi:phosphate transport system permease protein
MKESTHFLIRRIQDRIMRGLLFVFSIVATIPLILVLIYLIQKGVPGLNANFFTALPAPVGEVGGGLANAMVGSFILVGIGSFIGILVGLPCGIFLSEYGQGLLGRPLRFALELFTSIPSIVIGLFIYGLVVVPMKTFSGWAGALSLALIVLPVVARTSEEVLKLIPNHIREAGLALGLPRRIVIMNIVVRGALPGVMTGILLAVARAAGETAPLLFTAFNHQFWPESLSEPTPSLPVQIYNYAVSPFPDWHQQAWSGALVLVLGVFGTNLLSRLLFRRK